MRGKSLLNEKAIIILSLNQSECRKLLRSASSRIGFSRDTGIEESACKSACMFNFAYGCKNRFATLSQVCKIFWTKPCINPLV